VRNLARCGTVHDRPESAFTIAGIRNHVIAVQLAAGLAGGHRQVEVAIGREHHPAQQEAMPALLTEGVARSVPAVLGHDLLHTVPLRLINQSLVLAWIKVALVPNIADVQTVVQDGVQGLLAQFLT
jgi:hypothetical protein